MRRIVLISALLLGGVGVANAAVRDGAGTVNRAATRQVETVSRSAAAPKKTIISRGTAVGAPQSRTTQSVTPRASATVRATGTGAGQSRTATSARSAASMTSVRNNAGVTNINSGNTARTARSATTTVGAAARRTGVSRAAQSRSAIMGAATGAFGTGYNACRDAYFTCMDQFCATQDESYRRCVCSSRLADIQTRERALGQTSDQLADFKNLNLGVINKTAGEVKAMVSASQGEAAAASAKDTSASAQALSGISEVLAGTKTSALSTQGTLDIGGDIKSIWATTDFKGGANIANLTGEALYNAVHAQCAELVAAQCASQTTLNMVVSAYGMYIENDCAALSGALDKQLNSANSSIRSTEREMNTARLENYNAHNSSSINDCIANVRADITADTACGKNYVHCLDITGKYLNRTTGEPIYSADFYQLESQTSLAGDILTNQANRMIVAELNKKRAFAEKSLDLCRDVSTDVWDSFMRQAITEIYQGQQARVRQVKNECLDVINACYDEQNEQLKDFSNVKEQLLLGSRMELSEEMCREKLDACSNLYGGGADGLSSMLATLTNITDQKIAQNCLQTLQEYAKELCMVPSSDTLHEYPYSCRIYSPGEALYANDMYCNAQDYIPTGDSFISYGDDRALGPYYVCEVKRYISCNKGFYLGKKNLATGLVEELSDGTPGHCFECPIGRTCESGHIDNVGEGEQSPVCGEDYIGSLYHKMVRYALQACVRPSESSQPLPPDVLADVNTVIDSLYVDMRAQLAKECERWGGVWVSSAWVDQYGPSSSDLMGAGPDNRHDQTGHMRLLLFMQETSANGKWGYCADPRTI